MDAPDPGLRRLRIRFPRKKKPQGEEPEGSPAVLAQLAGVVQDLHSEVSALRRARVVPGGESPSPPSVVLPQLTRRPRAVPTVPSSPQVELPEIARRPREVVEASNPSQIGLPEIVRKQREVPTVSTPLSATLPQLVKKPRGEPMEKDLDTIVVRLNEAVQTLGDRVDRIMEVGT